MIRSFDELKKKASSVGKKRLVIAGGADRVAVESAIEAGKLGWIDPVLVGPKADIERVGSGLDLSLAEIVDEGDPNQMVLRAVEMVSRGDGDILMKGFVQTSAFLKGVLDKEVGLRTGKVLSHLAVLEVPNYHKLLFLTDGGMNIRPDLVTKLDIVQNAVNFIHSLGIDRPKVALLAAVETVNPKMEETIDAAHISKMAERKQIKGCIVDGPLAMDIILSKEAAEHKGVDSPVCGDTDIIVVHDIATGNAVAKALIYLANAKIAGLVLGARAPVVLLSRADSMETKLCSIALGVVSCEHWH